MKQCTGSGLSPVAATKIKEILIKLYWLWCFQQQLQSKTY